MTPPDFDTLLRQATELRHQTVRGRYAPSPTGSLHLGNLRTALYAWLQVRLADGQLVMRMEDLDQPRTKEGSAEEILDDLRWLGLFWDEGPDMGGPLGPYTQSERTEIYRQALQRLRDQDLVFECYCSRKDVREASSAPHGPGGVVYPGTCRQLTPEEQIHHQARHPGRNPSVRFVAPDKTISLCDAIAGDYAENVAVDVGDFVVRRSDQLFAYQLAVVIDDALMGITDVVRGDDLLASTPRQIALFETFDVDPPRFWHVPLMVDDEGERLSKRDGSASLRILRDERGWDAPRVIGHLAASLGWVDEDARLSARELLEEIDISDLRRPSPKTSAAEMSS